MTQSQNDNLQYMTQLQNGKSYDTTKMTNLINITFCSSPATMLKNYNGHTVALKKTLSNSCMLSECSYAKSSSTRTLNGMEDENAGLHHLLVVFRLFRIAIHFAIGNF